jgi:hypothetical protein
MQRLLPPSAIAFEDLPTVLSSYSQPPGRPTAKGSNASIISNKLARKRSREEAKQN